METDLKYIDKLISNMPLLFHPYNFSKPRDKISLEISSSKDTIFLQDFNPIENFNLNGFSSSSSSSPMFSMQPACLDPFDSNTSLEGLQNFDLDEPIYKPHGGNNSSLGFLMDNLDQSGGVEVLGHPQVMAPINIINKPSIQIYKNNFDCYDMGIFPIRDLPADESSCTTLKNDIVMSNNSLPTAIMMKKERRVRKNKTNIVKGQWTIDEDRVLVKLVERYGVRKWSQIAQMLNGRIGKQCRERWHNHLRPDIKKEVWSEEEDMILIKAHTEIGNKWAEIGKRLPGRTENSIKNHWNATKRRQFSRRKCRSKFPAHSSLLQDYIKNLAPEIINAGCRKKPSFTSPSVEKNPNSISPEINQTEESNPESYDFSEVSDFDFDFDSQIFKEISSFDYLLDGGGSKNKGDSENADIQTQIDLGSLMQFEVKKELDLMEMINLVNL